MKTKLLIYLIFSNLSLLSQTFELIYRTELDDWVGDAVLLNDEEVAFIISSGTPGGGQYPSKLFKLNLTNGMFTDSVDIEFNSSYHIFRGASVLSALNDGTIITRGFAKHLNSDDYHIFITHYDDKFYHIFDTIIDDINRNINDIRIYDDTLMVLCGRYSYGPPAMDYIEERDIFGNYLRGATSFIGGNLSTFHRTANQYHVYGESFNPRALLNISDLTIDSIINSSHAYHRALTYPSNSDDYYYVGAHKYRYPNKNNLVLLKVCSSGAILEEHEYFSNRNSYFASNGIAVKEDHIFLGSSEFFTNNVLTFVSEPRAIQLIKLNHNGEVIWQKTYKYLDVNYRLEKVLATPDGGALLFATRYDWLDPIPFQRDVYILKVDSDGNTVVGTENITQSRPGLKVYPNPASTVINIALEAKGTLSISVFDAIGSVVYSGEFTSAASIDVSGLRPGIYFYTISGQEGFHHHGRFIKN